MTSKSANSRRVMNTSQTLADLEADTWKPASSISFSTGWHPAECRVDRLLASTARRFQLQLLHVAPARQMLPLLRREGISRKGDRPPTLRRLQSDLRSVLGPADGELLLVHHDPQCSRCPNMNLELELGMLGSTPLWITELVRAEGDRSRDRDTRFSFRSHGRPQKIGYRRDRVGGGRTCHPAVSPSAEVVDQE
jgi:hypothetical protein